MPIINRNQGPTARHYSPSSFDTPSSVSLPTIVSAPVPIPTQAPKVKKKSKLDHPPPPDQELLDEKEAAYLMGVSVSFLNKDRHYAKRDGRPPIVPFKRVGKRKIIIKQSDIRAYMASGKVG